MKIVEGKLLIKTRDAAYMLGIGYLTFLELIKNEDFPLQPVEIPGFKGYMFSVKHLEEFIETYTRKPKRRAKKTVTPAEKAKVTPKKKATKKRVKHARKPITKVGNLVIPQPETDK